LQLYHNINLEGQKLKFLVINGPNMNMLGKREKEIYGTMTLDEIYEKTKSSADTLGDEVEFFQSSSEGGIIDAIHGSEGNFDGIIINPAGYSHYSVAVLDALKAVRIPAIEVHMSNIFSREESRKTMVTAAGCIGIIAGLGWAVYTAALYALHWYIINNRR
jgi:3-dehydroquinate dehydratase-2